MYLYKYIFFIQMKTHFLILAFACLFLQSEARLFGGSLSKWLGNDPSPQQDATDIAGGTQFSAPTAAGDTPHSRAGGPEVEKTADVIQTEISNGLRKDFQFIRDSMTAFADGDGFVREGLVFCGGPTVIAPPDGTDYHEDTGLLNIVDGYGNIIASTADKEACGASDCDEGSFVSLLANRIRALGYHVTHSDICIARAETALPASIVPTARTCKLQNNDLVRKSYECTKSDYEAGNDFFQINQKCYEGKDASACAAIKDNTTQMCTFDAIEKLCQAKNDYVKDKCNEGNAEEKSGESIGADGDEVNAVRRVISYSIRNPGEVPLTDKTYVTGVVANNGNNDCKSLRQYVAALNGMAQINAFRDRNIQEADDNWAETIKEARTFVASYAEILDNFYDKSLLIFPPIEFEEFQDCPAGDVRQSAKDDGTKAAPLCDNTDYSTISTFNEMTANSQALLRSQCFCRKGSLPQATKVADIDKYEADDFYLSMTDKGGRSNCTEFEKLPSVYQFCENGNMESQRWRNALEALEPHESSIKVFGTTAQQNERRAKIYNNLLKTLPLVSSKYKPNCGRLVSSDADEMMYSNKGGNCLPFPGMGELLYRLEFETSKAEIGSTRGAGGVGGATAGTFGTRFCQVSDRLANTLFSFRQIAYLWDHARFAGAEDTSVSVPTASALLTDFSNDDNTQTSTAGALTDQLFSHGDAKMCNIDWTEELTGQHTRKDSAGSSYDNPYLLFDREIEEAIFNAGVAVQAKRQNAADNENLWSALEAELTSVDTVRLNADIAYEAAEHFMRIVTTDSDDKAVDATDADGAVDAGTERPSPLDICDLDEAAASNNTCAKCTGDRAVTVADIDLYLSSTDAQKELQRATARSQPSKDWNSTGNSLDGNSLACGACPEDDQYINGSNVCVPCLGITTKTAYTAGDCDVPLCPNANSYMDNAAGGTWTCTACPHDSVAPAESVGIRSCKDPGCDAGEYYDTYKCNACPGNSTSPVNSTDISDCNGRNQCGANGAIVSGNTYYDTNRRICVSCTGELQSNATTDGVGAATCIPKECSAGTFWDNNNNKCEICAGNSTSDAGAVGQAECHGRSQCNSYDNHYFKAGDNSCQPCPHDSVHNASDPARVGQDSCIDPSCDAGLYYENFECKACPGNSTSVKGSTDVSDCNGDGVCDAGDYFEDGLNGGGGGTVNDCTACPHQSTSEQGQVSITACGDPGCDAGQYFQGFKCETCPGNSTSPVNSSGAQSCHGVGVCLDGQYFDDDNTTATHNQCVACPGESTSGGDQIGVATCHGTDVCAAGQYFEDGTGGGTVNDCTACPHQSTSIAGQVGIVACVDPKCAANTYYQSNITHADAYKCVACPGESQSKANSTAISDCLKTVCNAGDYYADDDSCKACPGNSTSTAGTIGLDSCNKEVCGVDEYYATDDTCTVCPGEKHTNGTNHQVGVASCGDAICDAGDYWEPSTDLCETCPGNSTTHEAGKVNASSCTKEVCDVNQYYEDADNLCTACPGEKHTNGTNHQVGVASCLDATCAAGQWWDGGNDKCQTCPGNSTSAEGSTAETDCNGVDVCTDTGQYFDTDTDLCTACPGDRLSENETLVGTDALCLFDVCDANQFMHGNDCKACPGSSTTDEHTVGTGKCDVKVATYIGFNDGDLLALFTDQQFTITNSTGSQDATDGNGTNAETKVCRSYVKLEADCQSGYSNADGTIVDIDLLAGQNECGAGSFDITDTNDVKLAQDWFGAAATDCTLIPSISKNSNEDSPNATEGNLVALDNAVDDDGEVIDVYNNLEDIATIHETATNITTQGNADYFQLLDLQNDTTATIEAAWNDYEPTGTNAGEQDEQDGYTAWTNDVTAYNMALEEYNTALTDYQNDLNDIYDAVQEIGADFEAIKTLSVAGAATRSAQGTADDKKTAFVDKLGDAKTRYDVLNDRVIGVAGFANGSTANDQFDRMYQKDYRASLFDAKTAADDYAADNLNIITLANSFGACTNGNGALAANNKLTIDASAAGDNCNADAKGTIGTKLTSLGVPATEWNSTAANPWNQFGAGTAKTLKTKYDAVIAARKTIHDKLDANNGAYNSETHAKRGDGNLPTPPITNYADPVAAGTSAKALNEALNGKTNAAWA